MESATSRSEDWGNLLKDPWRNLEGLSLEIADRPAYREVREWYTERMGVLPEFKQEECSLTDGKTWRAEFDENGQVSKIARQDNLFFAIEGRKLTKVSGDGKVLFSWEQPVWISRETPVNVDVFGQERNLPVNGFLGVIRDTEGKVLMTVDQEVTAETPNHAIVRLAIQASAGKIALMRSGKPEADRQLAELLKIYSDGDIEQLLGRAEFMLPIPPEDTNRDVKHNLVLVMPPIDSSSSLHTELEAGGKRKWLSREQLAMINLARLTNSHTMAAIRISEDARLLNISQK